MRTQRPALAVELLIIPCALPNSHILIVLSKLPLTKDLPSGANATEYTLSLWPSICPSSLSTSIPVRVSHTLTLLSSEPAATKSPFGDIATVVTPSSITRLRISRPLSRSQTRTVRSPLPDAMCLPLRAKSSEYMSCSCPVNVCLIVRASMSHT